MTLTRTNRNGDRRTVCLRLPHAVKSRLAKEVEERGVSLNDIIVRLLAQSLGLELDFAGSGRRGRSVDPTKVFVVLRVPPTLLEALRERAWTRRSNMTHEAALLIAGSLGVEVPVERPGRGVPFGGGHRRIP